MLFPDLKTVISLLKFFIPIPQGLEQGVWYKSYRETHSTVSEISKRWDHWQMLFPDHNFLTATEFEPTTAYLNG